MRNLLNNLHNNLIPLLDVRIIKLMACWDLYYLFVLSGRPGCAKVRYEYYDIETVR